MESVLNFVVNLLEPVLNFVLNVLPYFALVIFCVALVIFCFSVLLVCYDAASQIETDGSPILVLVGSTIVMLLSGILLALTR